jgi:tRNA(Leu) C34 or U34 (ribose-2'-O)-methylase TrmL
MTVKVVGHWERGWDTPWQEFNWWKHPLMEYGVNEFYMTPITGLEKAAVIEHTSIDTILSENSTMTHVYVDEAATTELPDFVHPENAMYIVGRTGYSPYLTHFREGIDVAVKIPSVTNNGGFWGHQAVTMILYDRYLKSR